MIDKKEKNEDTEFDIKQLTEIKIILRKKQYFSVDYLSYFILKPSEENIIIIKHNQNELNYDKELLLFGLRKSFKDNSYKIINPLKEPQQTDKNEIQILSKKLWYIVNSENKDKVNEDYILNENDIIKFGNYIFEVIKINVPKKEEKHASNEAQNENQLYDISSLNNKYGPLFKIINFDNKEDSGQNDKKKLTCKICGEDSNNKKNPLLKFCEYNNHFECLKTKMIDKLINKDNLESQNVYSFNSEDFKCNCCQKIIPMRFEKSGIIYNFLEIENMFYIVLELLEKIEYRENENDEKNENNKNDEKNSNNKKQKSTKIYVINLENKSEIKIGRDKGKIKNDINIQDNFISRSHAVIKFENGNLILENRSHKEVIFDKENGTLIQKQGNKGKIENVNEEKLGKLELSKTFVLIKDNFKLKENEIYFRVCNCYIKAKLNKKINTKKINKK